MTTAGLHGKLMLSVKDNGFGIAEKIKQKIFQLFFTAEPAGTRTGMGLSLSYDVIAKENGG